MKLSDSSIGDNGVPALARAIKTNSTLRELNLSENGICQFSDNYIRNVGVVVLGEGIKTNSTLRELNFASSIGVNGVSAPAEAIKTNSTLTELNLSHNNGIGDDVVVSLAEAIKGQSTLC